MELWEAFLVSAGDSHVVAEKSVWVRLICCANRVGIVEVTWGLLTLLLSWRASDGVDHGPHRRFERSEGQPTTQ